MSFQAVVFDLDGTLIDSLEDIADAMNRALQDLGYPGYPTDDYRMFVGSGLARLVERTLPAGVGRQVQQGCAERFREIYRETCNAKTRAYDGVPQLLQALTERGIRLAVLSNKPHSFTVACVEHQLADVPFDVVLGQQDGIPHKPDPTGALQIADQLSTVPRQCLFLGDTAVDMQTARNAGMFPVGALWGFRDRDELLEGGAEVLIERPGELLTLVTRREP
jgi:phosphoglycolate phosphatase